MNTFQKNALFLALLLFVFVGGGALAYSAYRNHEQKIAEERIAWNKENIRTLEDLSQIGILSTEEQDRLDRAGDDPNRIQQVLLDLHTERHTIWAAKKFDSDDRVQKFQDRISYNGYSYLGSYQETAAELRKEQALIDENLQGFERGYVEIKAWRPVSFDGFLSGNRPVNPVNFKPKPSPIQQFSDVPSASDVVTSEPSIIRQVSAKPSQATGNVVYTCETRTHRIAIEKLADEDFQYRSWNKPRPLNERPDLDLKAGKKTFSGTGACAHPTYTFLTGNVTIEVDGELGCTDGSEPAKATGHLSVTIGEKLVTNEYCS